MLTITPPETRDDEIQVDETERDSILLKLSPTRVKANRNAHGFNYIQLIVGMIIFVALSRIVGPPAFRMITRARSTALEANIQTAAETVRNVLAIDPASRGDMSINTDGAPTESLLAALTDDAPGDLHRWMRQIGHDGRLFKSASDPVEVHSMAQRLSSEERVRVDEMARAGVDVDEMARRLGRHRSTVHRELKRCGGRCGYDAEAAQAAADLRARRPKTPKLAGDPVLAAAVGGLLADRMSPHAISAQLRSEGHGICAETVYAACYDHSGARGLPEGSWKLLPRRCRKRRPRGRHARKPSPLGDFKAISQRPASVEDRRQPGHWEGDLIIGKANRSAVATLVERTSRQTLTVALPHGYDAHNTAAAVTAALARQPRHLVKTLTWDQGREMARWPDIEATLGIEVYFCDPHSPWQRPTNEQTNDC